LLQQIGEGGTGGREAGEMKRAVRGNVDSLHRMDEGFLYQPAPNPRGGFTCRAVKGEQITEAELDAAVAAETGLPPEQCAQVLKAYLRQMLAKGATSRWSPGLYGLIGFYPTAGGNQPGHDDFHTAEQVKAGMSIAFSLDAIRAWRQGLRLVSQGFTGRVTPKLATVICCTTDKPDVYVSGHLIGVRGAHLKLDQHDPAQGIFFILADGTEVRCETYGGNTRLRVYGRVPEGVTGPIQVRVAAHIYGSVRSTLYTTPLQEVPAPVYA
ncbi:MAG TPA: hypothetical protein DIT13_14530, partial [Verrucomicrobiales bacterium]|nr:hypothetical protein [Verrucomicrobiales bacterium]